MSESLTLRTAFFNLVGGRRQDSSEGFRVNGNLRTHSGESLGFYAVSEATPPGPMGSRARRLVLDVFEEEVASEIELSIGSRLRHGVSQAHLALQSEFNGHVQVGLTVVISSENSIYLLQVAPAQAYVKHDDALHAISPTGNAQAGFSRALGGQAEPEVFLFRDSIEEGDLILLTTSWVAQALDPDHLRDAFAE